MRELKTIVVASLNFPPYTTMFEQPRRVYGKASIAPTLLNGKGGNLEHKILEIYETPI